MGREGGGAEELGLFCIIKRDNFLKLQKPKILKHILYIMHICHICFSVYEYTIFMENKIRFIFQMFFNGL